MIPLHRRAHIYGYLCKSEDRLVFQIPKAHKNACNSEIRIHNVSNGTCNSRKEIARKVNSNSKVGNEFRIWSSSVALYQTSVEDHVILDPKKTQTHHVDSMQASWRRAGSCPAVGFKGFCVIWP